MLTKGSDKRSRQQHSFFLLPAPGNLTWELYYDYRAYVGMFDRGAAWRVDKGEKGLVPIALGPTADFDEGGVVKFTAEVPVACHQSEHCEQELKDLTPCKCSDLTPMLPGYWHIAQDRWIPLYHLMPVLSTAVVRETLRCPSNVVLLGTSRTRTVFYDLVGLAGGDTSKAKKIHRSLSAPPVHYVYSHCAKDITPCGVDKCHDDDPGDKNRTKFGRLDANATNAINVTISEFNEKMFCTSRLDGRKDFVFWSSGTCEVSWTKPPAGFSSGVQYAEAHLKALKRRCAHHHLVVVLELGVHDRWQSPQVVNSFKNNRILAFNKRIIKVAAQLDIPVIDAYTPSQAYHFDDIWTSKEKGVDRAHYYTRNVKQNQFTGNAASKLVAKMLLQYMRDKDMCRGESREARQCGAQP